MLGQRHLHGAKTQVVGGGKADVRQVLAGLSEARLDPLGLGRETLGARGDEPQLILQGLHRLALRQGGAVLLIALGRGDGPGGGQPLDACELLLGEAAAGYTMKTCRSSQ